MARHEDPTSMCGEDFTNELDKQINRPILLTIIGRVSWTNQADRPDRQTRWKEQIHRLDRWTS